MTLSGPRDGRSCWADALHRIPGIMLCDPLTEEERREGRGRGGGGGEGEKGGTDGEEKGEEGKIQFSSIQNTLLSVALITIKWELFLRSHQLCHIK